MKFKLPNLSIIETNALAVIEDLEPCTVDTIKNYGHVFNGAKEFLAYQGILLGLNRLRITQDSDLSVFNLRTEDDLNILLLAVELGILLSKEKHNEDF